MSTAWTIHFKHLLHSHRVLMLRSLVNFPSHGIFFHFPFSFIRMTLLAMYTPVYTAVYYVYSTNTRCLSPEAVCETHQVGNSNEQEVFDTIVLDVTHNRGSSNRLLDCCDCVVIHNHHAFFFARLRRAFLSGLPMIDFQPEHITVMLRSTGFALEQSSMNTSN